MDDGLLLNFDTGSFNEGSGGSRPVAVKVKGHWRDKRRSLKQARKQHARVDKSNDSQAAVVPIPASKTDNEPKSVEKRDAAPSARKPPRPKESSAVPRMTGSKHNKNIVDKETFLSSLFSSNPEVEAAAPVSEPANLSVTNAPLGDGSFAGLGIADKMVKVLNTKLNIDHPTEIQRRAIPQIKDHERDTFVIAQTGSGKTLAYVLPIVARLMSEPQLSRTSGVFAVILAPTRELATQIHQVLEEVLAACHWLVSGVVIGGEKKKSEKARLRKGVNILVGTPGRIADHFSNTSSLDLAEVRWVVLDEGDRLVELGFEETLTDILDKIKSSSNLNGSPFKSLPRERSHVLCSATMTGSIMRLKTLTLDDPIWIRSGDSDDVDTKEVAPGQLEQNIVVVPAKLRLVTLAAVLRQVSSKGAGKAVVFFSCSDSVDFHFSAFTSEDNASGIEDFDKEDDEDKEVIHKPATRLSKNITIFRLHGSLTQQQRSKTLAEFTNFEGQAILFSTDVASRGLDVSLANVIEYDPPFAVEDHIHRVGRTARAGKEGRSFLFLLPGAEEKYEEKLKPVHPNGIQHTAFKTILQKSFGSKWEVDATTWHLSIERWLLQDEQAISSARKAFTSHIRAYTTHISAERNYFSMKELHLGHLAKSFGLRETPGKLAGPGGSAKRDRDAPRKPKKLTGINALMATARKHMAMDEYNIA